MNAADFEALFEDAPFNLLVLLPDSPRFTQVAATKQRYIDTLTTREKTIGVGLFELFPDNPDDPTATGTRNLRASLERVLATKKEDTMAVQRYDVRDPDGTFQSKYWSPKNIPVLDDKGDIKYIYHRAEDITELVIADAAQAEQRGRANELEREVLTRSRELHVANTNLRDANERLGELDAAKTAFFDNVSHELRTPLTLMLGPIEDMLESDSLTREERTRLELAHGNALRLLRLVNTLLDFSRIQAGRLSATFAPLDVGTFTAELAGMFQSAAAKANLKFNVDCPPLREPVYVDRDLWEKVVPNLVSNALKYTLEGGVNVQVREEADKVVISVADTGIGIPEDDLPRLFERFYRVPGAVGRTLEGTGIGLSLVRELVELHGGTVEVHSTVGKGTRFDVAIRKGYSHLPADAVSQTPADIVARRDLKTQTIEAMRWAGDSPMPAQRVDEGRRAHVLIVDDNADLRAYIHALLSPLYDVSVAVDGRDGVDAALKDPPDIVVSDVMMPRLDGTGLVRELRAEPSTASIPVILLSARVGEESAIEGLDAGADDYVVKPFSARELIARVRTHIELAQQRRSFVRELERTNRELDAFSSSVSHDLRTPVGHVKGFIELLRDDPTSVLSDRAKRYVDNITTASTRMLALIEHLLRFAKISRQPLELAPADLSAIVSDIVSVLQHGVKDRSVTVKVAPDVRSVCDGGLVRLVLDNLLSNAFKYSSKKQDAKIEFGANKTSEGPVYFVRDNGAGFDQKDAPKLFTPFVRLHSESEFPGTGIGLATTQRIVDRHGGRIWAESAVGHGTTFFFTLSA